ncbi:MAG: phosphodiester glycosidase family protein [Bacteroidota bacterium]
MIHTYLLRFSHLSWRFGLSVLAMLMLSFSTGAAQDCADIERQADLLLIRKQAAERKNRLLLAEFAEKRLIIKDLGATPPQGIEASLPQVANDAPKYHDDRNYPRCKAQWGDTDWGQLKDYREYNLDNFITQNLFLKQEIANLNQIITALKNRTTLPTPPKDTAPPPTLPINPPVDVAPAPTTSAALTPGRVPFEGKTYVYCVFNPKLADVRIANNPGRTKVYGIDKLDAKAQQEGKYLTFAMNGGMYEPDKSPVGLLVYKGKVLAPLNERSGQGNFYMKPNGIFGIDAQGNASIWPTPLYVRQKVDTRRLLVATQSGPVMLLNGKINKAFTPGSANVHFRNAIGVREDGQVVCAISEQRVNFYEFADFLRSIGCTQALYLDGTVSRMYLPLMNKTRALTDSRHLGPLLYIVE